VGDGRGDTTPPDGSGVPDSCGGTKKQRNAVGRSRAIDKVPGRSAKRVTERRRGRTRTSHSERKRNDLGGGKRERMAECRAIEALEVWCCEYVKDVESE
jgi:hypothetical protein